MKKSIFLIVCLLQLGTLFAQKDEVNKYLRLVAYGKIDEVKSVIPDLLAKYPNDAGVKLLHGTILDDAFLALEIYQSILKNYPESEWADHAYWRIVQFYAIVGDTTKAQAELANFRSRYPASAFITPASDVVRSSVNLARKNLKSAVSLNTVQTKPIVSQKPALAEPNTNIENKNTSMKDVKINPDKMAETVQLSQTKLPKIEPKQNTEKPTIEKIVNENKPNIPAINPKPLQTTEVVVAEKQVAKPEIKDVEIKKVNPSNEPAFWGLQVGIYKDRNSADAEKNKFLVKRLRTSVIEKQVNGTLMFAVVIGHYSTLESAEEGKKIVSIQCGCEPLVYQK
jgi:hypothetical protein